MTTRIYFVRQGITDYHLFRIVPGRIPCPLNEIGNSQAYATAELLKDLPFNHAFTSNAKACEQTANIILEAAQNTIPILRAGDLRARNVANSEGKYFWDVMAANECCSWEDFDSIKARAKRFLRSEILPFNTGKGSNFVLAVVCDDFIRCLPPAFAQPLVQGGCGYPMIPLQVPDDNGISATVRSGSVSILEINKRAGGEWLTYGFADHLPGYKDPLSVFDLNRNIVRRTPPPWRTLSHLRATERSQIDGLGGALLSVRAETDQQQHEQQGQEGGPLDEWKHEVGGAVGTADQREKIGWDRMSY